MQTRSDAATNRFQDLVAQYRRGDFPDSRRGNVRAEIIVLKRRCDLMNVASIIGLASAVVLILALISGELAISFKSVPVFGYISAVGILVGLLLVVAATCVVSVESFVVHRQLQSEVLDIPELAQAIGQQPGVIDDPERPGRG